MKASTFYNNTQTFSSVNPNLISNKSANQFQENQREELHNFNQTQRFADLQSLSNKGIDLTTDIKSSVTPQNPHKLNSSSALHQVQLNLQQNKQSKQQVPTQSQNNAKPQRTSSAQPQNRLIQFNSQTNDFISTHYYEQQQLQMQQEQQQQQQYRKSRPGTGKRSGHEQSSAQVSPQSRPQQFLFNQEKELAGANTNNGNFDKMRRSYQSKSAYQKIVAVQGQNEEQLQSSTNESKFKQLVCQVPQTQQQQQPSMLQMKNNNMIRASQHRQQSTKILNENGRKVQEESGNTTLESSLYHQTDEENEEGVLLAPQRRNDIGKKTLVLDLDETLVHSSFKPIDAPDIVLPVEIEGSICKIFILIRPGVQQFLKKMSKLYEIIIFTASLSKYADPLMCILDPEGLCSQRLFREHCTLVNSAFVKDLTRLGRQMKDVIIVDNSPIAYMFQPENALPILSWYDNMEDKELMRMAQILDRLAYEDDVRKVLKIITLNNEVDPKQESIYLNSQKRDHSQRVLDRNQQQTNYNGKKANSRYESADNRQKHQALINEQAKKRNGDEGGGNEMGTENMELAVQKKEQINMVALNKGRKESQLQQQQQIQQQQQQQQQININAYNFYQASQEQQQQQVTPSSIQILNMNLSNKERNHSKNKEQQQQQAAQMQEYIKQKENSNSRKASTQHSSGRPSAQPQSSHILRESKESFKLSATQDLKLWNHNVNSNNEGKHSSTTKGQSKNGGVFFNSSNRFQVGEFASSQNTTPISKRSSSYKNKKNSNGTNCGSDNLDNQIEPKKERGSSAQNNQRYKTSSEQNTSRKKNTYSNFLSNTQKLNKQDEKEENQFIEKNGPVRGGHSQVLTKDQSNQIQNQQQQQKMMESQNKSNQQQQQQILRSSQNAALLSSSQRIAMNGINHFQLISQHNHQPSLGSQFQSSSLQSSQAQQQSANMNQNTQQMISSNHSKKNSTTNANQMLKQNMKDYQEIIKLTQSHINNKGEGGSGGSGVMSNGMNQPQKKQSNLLIQSQGSGDDGSFLKKLTKTSESQNNTNNTTNTSSQLQYQQQQQQQQQQYQQQHNHHQHHSQQNISKLSISSPKHKENLNILNANQTTQQSIPLSIQNPSTYQAQLQHQVMNQQVQNSSNILMQSTNRGLLQQYDSQNYNIVNQNQQSHHSSSNNRSSQNNHHKKQSISSNQMQNKQMMFTENGHSKQIYRLQNDITTDENSNDERNMLQSSNGIQQKIKIIHNTNNQLRTSQNYKNQREAASANGFNGNGTGKFMNSYLSSMNATPTASQTLRYSLQKALNNQDQ